MKKNFVQRTELQPILVKVYRLENCLALDVLYEDDLKLEKQEEESLTSRSLLRRLCDKTNKENMMPLELIHLQDLLLGVGYWCGWRDVEERRWVRRNC